jgi:hypothetical protein
MDRKSTNNSIVAHKIFTRNCPKCHTGKLSIEHDSLDGDYETCYACGYIYYIPVKPREFTKQELGF